MTEIIEFLTVNGTRAAQTVVSNNYEGLSRYQDLMGAVVR